MQTNLPLEVYSAKQKSFGKHQIGKSVVSFADLEKDKSIKSKFDFALFCLSRKKTDFADAVRESLFQLYFYDFKVRILDLGNLKLKGNKAETEELQKLFHSLAQNLITPIVICEDEELSFLQYDLNRDENSLIKLLFLNNQLFPNPKTNKKSLLGKLLDTYHPPYDEMAYLGIQNFLTDPELEKWMLDKKVSIIRLSKILGKHSEMSAIYRNFNRFNIDLSCIKMGDAGACKHPSPNGFSALEICQIMRSVGLNERLQGVSFVNYKSKADTDKRTAILLAQMIWQIWQGYAHRIFEIPDESSKEFTVYKVLTSEQSQVYHLIKSKLTQRWWLQSSLPKSDFSDTAMNHWIPCDESDYEYISKHHKLPETWWTNKFIR